MLKQLHESELEDAHIDLDSRTLLHTPSGPSGAQSNAPTLPGKHRHHGGHHHHSGHGGKHHGKSHQGDHKVVPHHEGGQHHGGQHHGKPGHTSVSKKGSHGHTHGQGHAHAHGHGHGHSGHSGHSGHDSGGGPISGLNATDAAEAAEAAETAEWRKKQAKERLHMILRQARLSGIPAATISNYCDCTAADLLKAGYPPTNVNKVHKTDAITALREAGFTALDLKKACFSSWELKTGGFSGRDTALDVVELHNLTVFPFRSSRAISRAGATELMKVTLTVVPKIQPRAKTAAGIFHQLEQVDQVVDQVDHVEQVGQVDGDGLEGGGGGGDDGGHAAAAAAAAASAASTSSATGQVAQSAQGANGGGEVEGAVAAAHRRNRLYVPSLSRASKMDTGMICNGHGLSKLVLDEWDLDETLKYIGERFDCIVRIFRYLDE